VPLSEAEIIELLGREYFEPGWELSYSYRNETINLRRVEFRDDHPDHPEFHWWQVHVRGYRHGPAGASSFELAAHFELEPTEYPRSHVEHVGLEIRRGAVAIRDILEAHDVDYEYRYANGDLATVDEEPMASDGAEPGS